jgi:transcriptional regulator with XRE-family HTH domain
MATVDVSQVIRRVRQRMGLSQEALARLLNATKGAVQHWERNRNQPDLARLLLLRTLCPSETERKDVEGIIRQVQARVTDPRDIPIEESAIKRWPAEPASQALARENARLRRQVNRLEKVVQRRAEQLRILEDLAADLQRQVAQLQARQEQPAPGPRDSAMSITRQQA